MPLPACCSQTPLCCLPQAKMADSGVSGNPDEFQKVARAAADMEEKVTAWREYQQVVQELRGAKQMLSDSGGDISPLTLQSLPLRPAGAPRSGTVYFSLGVAEPYAAHLGRQAIWQGYTEHAATLACYTGLPSATEAPRPITVLTDGKHEPGTEPSGPGNKAGAKAGL